MKPGVNAKGILIRWTQWVTRSAAKPLMAAGTRIRPAPAAVSRSQPATSLLPLFFSAPRTSSASGGRAGDRAEQTRPAPSVKGSAIQRARKSRAALRKSSAAYLTRGERRGTSPGASPATSRM